MESSRAITLILITNNMAQIIKWEGTVTDVQPKNGTDFSLGELKEAVNGYIEILRTNDGRLLVCNEDGKLLRLDYNPVATILAHRLGIIAPANYIVGNVLVCNVNEIK